ncbi:MAG: glycosyltransferase family 4 protein [Bacillota bacterium]|nr:glycosyltransferase family 4 protein [Bacillota bacterium]
MKIAMIGQKGIPAKDGGVERHVEEIATRLAQQKHEITVYCRSTYMNNEIDVYKGVNLKNIKTIDNKNLDAIVYTFKSTMDALNKGFDAFHYHAIGPASLCFIPSLKKKKVIVTVHGLDWQRAKWGKFAKLYLKFGEYMTGKYATKIISVSENLREYFIEKYHRKEEDVIFIPNGVNMCNPEQPELIKNYSLEKDNYILFLARLVPEKGVHYLIEAYNQLNTYKKLVIAGGTSFTEDYLEKLMVLANNNPNIIFTGNVDGKLKNELYSNCYIYVLPSDIEGMPLTLLEAMSYKKCCLVSNIPENINVIKDNGAVFEKSSIEDLKEKIELLLDNEERVREKGLNAYKDISQNYNWSQIINSMQDLYRDSSL